MRIHSKLVAIDPYDCGCTDCLTGVYKPLAVADDDQIQALFLGLLDDNTGSDWVITQQDDGTFHISAESFNNPAQQHVTQTWNISKIVYPITVKDYVLDIDLDTVVENLVHLRH